MAAFVIEELTPAAWEVAEMLLDEELGGRSQVRLGEMRDVLALPGFCAWQGESLIGVATFGLEDGRAELAVIAVAENCRLQGVGAALVDVVVNAVTALGAGELWLVTTNDNVDALLFYQRRGFLLREVLPGAVERARHLKPTIPLVGRHGVPIRDELILARPLI